MPISRSEKQKKSIPTYFISYEIERLASELGEHPSVIYQELMDIYKEKEKE